MDEDPNRFDPAGEPPPPSPSRPNAVKRAVGPIAVAAAFLAKIKVFIFPMLKMGVTMLISIWAYAHFWGWPFAVGFVALIFVHECGHLLAAWRLGLRVSAPMFIPFMGALIALKEAPRNAWVESQVGIGGPLLGTLGSAICYLIFRFTGNEFYAGLAYSGFFLNLFNLAPFGFLDGGRIVTALSPWLWLVGAVIIGVMMIFHFNFILLLIFIFSLPRLLSLFRRRSVAEQRYYEVTAAQRLIMGSLYFGLIVLLVLGMAAAKVEVPEAPPRAGETISSLRSLDSPDSVALMQKSYKNE